MGMMNKADYKDLKPGKRVKYTTDTCKGHGDPEKCSCPVKQEFARECDINEIMKRYPGAISRPTPEQQGVFADVSEIGSLAEVMRRGDAARDAFLALPAQLRSRFDNDPYAFLDFVSNDANYDQAVALGLIENSAAEKSAKAAAAKEAAPAS